MMTLTTVTVYSDAALVNIFLSRRTMCEPIDWSRLRGHDPSSPPDLLTIEATAVTGFEGAAASEVAEKFCIEEEEVVKAQGRVLFDIPENLVEEVMDPLH